MNAQKVTSEMAVAEVAQERLLEDMKMVMTDAEELLKATANQTGERIVAARSKAEESLQAARARLAEARLSAVEKVRVAAKCTDGYVHDHPWQSMGVAAVLGLALGALISRR
jgi:ElaB/YqjD/DUF883 family membrane-anchored ribosome-binding protein